MVSFAHVRTQAHDIFISQAGISRCECKRKRPEQNGYGCTRIAPALVVAFSPGGQSAKLLLSAALSPLCFRLFSFEGCHVAEEESAADRTSR